MEGKSIDATREALSRMWDNGYAQGVKETARWTLDLLRQYEKSNPQFKGITKYLKGEVSRLVKKEKE